MKKDKNGRPVPNNPTHDLPMRLFFDHIPEPEFREALENAPDAKYQQLLTARLSPQHQNTTFMRLCHNFGISLQDVHELWRHHQLHRAMIEMSNVLPEVTRDLGEDARSRLAYCPRCDGLGYVTDTGEGSEDAPAGADSRGEGRRVCPACEGARKVRVIGDKASREMLLESVGFIGKKSPLVNINQHFGLDSELGDLLAASQRVIHPEREP